MFFKSILLILSLPTFLLFGSVIDQSARHSKAIPPAWVKLYDFPLNAVPVKPSQVNLQYLVIDTQRNWEEKILYRHFAVKALTQSGIEKISQLKIDFDPTYTEVIMHTIRVFREGKWLDRLDNARYNLIQRATELEDNLYNGDLTLVYFLEDIREGDILEYSYSLKGSYPLFASHYTDRVYLQREFAVEKIIYRLLGNQSLSFLIKPTNTNIEPKICDLSPFLREWSWEAVDTLPYLYEAQEPVWYNPPAHIEMSQYNAWEEVVKKLYPLYVLPSNFSQLIPSDMQALVEQWKATTHAPQQRALLALRFVQDQVRYLGIEEGMGAFQPTDPCLTFRRRFGDCKDKAFLLHALLRLIGIPSSPLLVHTSHGKRLPEVLPTPFMFNHLVLQIQIEDMTYYVDPTLTLQGGSLQTNFFPDYEWGLLLGSNSQELIALPKATFKNPIEIDTSYILESEDLARVTVKSIFPEFKADQLRRSLEWNGLKKLEEGSLSTMQKAYGTATVDAPMEFSDDRENNIITLIESYRLSTKKLPNKKVIKIFSHTLRSYLQNEMNPQRTSPYQLYYPFWVKERIYLNNSLCHWQDYEEDLQKEHESLSYKFSARIGGNKAVFNLELKHLKDHISKDSLQKYCHVVDEIERNGPGTLPAVLLQTCKKDSSWLLICPICALYMWPLIYLFYRRNRAQDLLMFYRKIFQTFYSGANVLSLIAISDRLGYSILITCGIMLVPCIAWHFITTRRSIKSIWMLQGLVILHACLLSCLLLTSNEVQNLEKTLGLCTICFYLGTFLIILNKSRRLLLEEKKTTNAIS